MLTIGSYTFNSRLFLGTGKFSSIEVQREAIAASQSEVLTFALRRVNLHNPDETDLLSQLDAEKFALLPNTAGAQTADEAIRLARLAKGAGVSDMIKIEVVGDERTLLPDPLATLQATEVLVKEGFIVLPYTNDDPVLARQLQEAGAHAVMPGASPIGSGLGILNPTNIALIIEQARVPIIVDAGIGSPADVALAMELGADGVLLNSAVSRAENPVKMAHAMRLAVEAGRLGFEAGRIAKQHYAVPSSPTEGRLGS